MGVLGSKDLRLGRLLHGEIVKHRRLLAHLTDSRKRPFCPIMAGQTHRIFFKVILIVPVIFFVYE
jgi:hypothetical protein